MSGPLDGTVVHYHVGQDTKEGQARVKLSRLSKGDYTWEISAVGEEEDVLVLIRRVDARLMGEYGRKEAA
jgi:hypothetical protein